MLGALEAKGRKLTLGVGNLALFVKVGEEQSVDQRGLPQAALSCSVWGTVSALIAAGGEPRRRDSPATISVKAKPFLAVLRCT